MKVKEINRFEKTILITISSLGAGIWGYGLMLLLLYPGDYNDYFHSRKWLIIVIESIVEISIFSFFSLAVLKKWLTERRKAWLLFFIVLAGSILFQYVFYTLSEAAGFI